MHAQQPTQQEFLSTLSLRRATSSKIISSSITAYFYPRSPCGERPVGFSAGRESDTISIHALLAESDILKNNIFFHHSLFLSTLSLRRATPVSGVLCGLIIFLSTLSLRRATSALAPKQNPTEHFYPRSPCGERLSR